MARRRSSRSYRTGEAVFSSNRRLPRPIEQLHVEPWSPGQAAEAFADDEVYQRSGPGEEFLAPAVPPRGVITPAKQPFDFLRRLYVRAPVRERFCVQRKIRREVMHALGLAGRRGLGRGGVRRRSSSSWRC